MAANTIKQLTIPATENAMYDYSNVIKNQLIEVLFSRCTEHLATIVDSKKIIHDVMLMGPTLRNIPMLTQYYVSLYGYGNVIAQSVYDEMRFELNNLNININIQLNSSSSGNVVIFTHNNLKFKKIIHTKII